MDTRFTVLSPTRVDLAGGTLDLWPLNCFVEKPRTVNLALDLYARCDFDARSAARMSLEWVGPTGHTHTSSSPLSWQQSRELHPALQFPVGVVSAYLGSRSGVAPMRLRIQWSSQVPIGSGLGGSSALGVGLLRGMSRIFGDYTEQGWQWQMLGTIRDMEAAFLGTPTGTQDYLAALFGGLSSFVFMPGKITRDTYPEASFEGLASRLIVAFSGEQHHSGRSNWEIYKAAVEAEPNVVKGLRQIARIAEQLDGTLRATRVDWAQVGKLLSEEWGVRRECFEVSTPRLDQWVSRLKSLKVLGAKVCGAAAGGSFLALVEPQRRDEVTHLLQSEGLEILQTYPTQSGVTIS